MRKEDVRRIEAFEMWIWRRMEGMSWREHKTNEVSKEMVPREKIFDGHHWGHPFMTSTRRGVRLRWTHVDRGRGSSPMWTSTQKIEFTDVILSSFHAKTSVSFLPEFRLSTELKVENFLRYKLVI